MIKRGLDGCDNIAAARDLIGMLRALDCVYIDNLAGNNKRNQGNIFRSSLLLEPGVERKEEEAAWAGRCSCTSHLA